ncbi:MAG: hypothetical protein IKO16_05985 [Lachnospiraceae bacterium]|nr:hypothetical protein [Lachnospiraceae bacterium]
MNNKSIFEQVNESTLPEDEKQMLLSIFRGEQLANVCYDAVAKHVFSPDLHPDRMDYILQHTMNLPGISVSSSASNESYMLSINTKKTISDLPAWLKDHTLFDLAFQWDSQEFIFTRAEIYASSMLLLQYTVESGQSKQTIDCKDINGVIIIVLMKESPKLFKRYESPRYIHRFTRARADSGLEVPTLRQMVFVQLDKALELYVSGNYNEDEDTDLLKLFALIADINNEKVVQESTNNKLLSDIREDVFRFTRDKEVQHMLLADDIERINWYGNMNLSRKEGRTEVNDLYKWLFSQKRDADVKKATEDPDYLDTLLAEYNNAQAVARS